MLNMSIGFFHIHVEKPGVGLSVDAIMKKLILLPGRQHRLSNWFDKGEVVGQAFILTIYYLTQGCCQISHPRHVIVTLAYLQVDWRKYIFLSCC